MQRIVSLDAARYLAALGVIWIHVCQTPATTSLANFGRFAVPFFAATAAYLLVLSLQRKAELSFLSFLTSRVHRLYLPFLAWSGVYLSFKWMRKEVLGHDETILPGWDVFVLGGAYHLWFIPYLISASLVTFVLLQAVGQSAKRQLRAATICYFVGTLLAILLTIMPDSESALYFMLMTTPAFLWGLSLGWLKSAEFNAASLPLFAAPSRLLTLAASGLLVTSILIPWVGARSPLLENAAGFALLLAAIYVGLFSARNSSQSGFSRIIGRLGQVSLGIYFCHLLFIKVAEAVIGRFDIQENVATAAGLFVVVTLAATVCSLVACQFKSTKWLVA